MLMDVGHRLVNVFLIGNVCSSVCHMVSGFFL